MKWNKLIYKCRKRNSVVVYYQITLKVVDFDPLAAEIEMLHFTKGASILRKIEEMIGGLGAKKKDEGLGGDVGDGWCICGNTTVGSNVCSACYCCDGIIVNDLSQYSYKSMNDNDEVEKEIVFNELFEKCQNIFGCSITKPGFYLIYIVKFLKIKHEYFK